MEVKLKFQDKFYDMIDHNKCPTSEKSAEKCILRNSYFHHSEPSHDVFLYIICTVWYTAVTGWSKLATLGWGSPFKVKLSWHVCQALNNNLNWLQLLSIQILKYDFEHVSLYCIPLKLSCLHSLLFSLQVSCLYSLHSPLQMSKYKY